MKMKIKNLREEHSNEVENMRSTQSCLKQKITEAQDEESTKISDTFKAITQQIQRYVTNKDRNELRCRSHDRIGAFNLWTRLCNYLGSVCIPI